MGFAIPSESGKKLTAWMKEQDAKVIDRQKGTSVEHPGEAYYGCSGGAYTYMFTPTSIGLVVKVQNGLTGDIIDLTDYEDW